MLRCHRERRAAAPKGLRPNAGESRPNDRAARRHGVERAKIVEVRQSAKGRHWNGVRRCIERVQPIEMRD